MRRRPVVAKLAATGVSIFMAIITIAWPAWIELVLGSAPDRGNGLLKIMIVGVLAAAAFTFSLAARAEFRRGALAKPGTAR